LVNVRAEKMSKSLGNFTTAREILERYPPGLVKFYLLSTHYRSPIEFGERSLDEARPGWERLDGAARRLAGFERRLVGLGRQRPEWWLEQQAPPEGWEQGRDEVERRALRAVRGVREAFEAAMDDDFNTPRALGSLFDLVREVNPLAERLGSPEAVDPSAPSPGHLIVAAASALLRLFAGQILGVVEAPGGGPAPGPDRQGQERLVASLVELVLEMRQRARAERRFQEADEMRRRLAEAGVVVEDTPAGPRWRLQAADEGRPG
ncbi:MAG TPA: DALR domain-containing protein, partial [Limnochordales bacterium]